MLNPFGFIAPRHPTVVPTPPLFPYPFLPYPNQPPWRPNFFRESPMRPPSSTAGPISANLSTVYSGKNRKRLPRKFGNLSGDWGVSRKPLEFNALNASARQPAWPSTHVRNSFKPSIALCCEPLLPELRMECCGNAHRRDRSRIRELDDRTKSSNTISLRDSYWRRIGY